MPYLDTVKLREGALRALVIWPRYDKLLIGGVTRGCGQMVAWWPAPLASLLTGAPLIQDKTLGRHTDTRWLITANNLCQSSWQWCTHSHWRICISFDPLIIIQFWISCNIVESPVRTHSYPQHTHCSPRWLFLKESASRCCISSVQLKLMAPSKVLKSA